MNYFRAGLQVRSHSDVAVGDTITAFFFETRLLRKIPDPFIILKTPF